MHLETRCAEHSTADRPVGAVLGVHEGCVPPLLPLAPAAMGCTLVVHLRPGVAALQGVLAVLHARAASIAELAYTVHADAARMEIRLLGSPEQSRRLASQVDRRVDVLATRLARDPVHVDDEPAPPWSDGPWRAETS